LLKQGIIALKYEEQTILLTITDKLPAASTNDSVASNNTSERDYGMLHCN